MHEPKINIDEEGEENNHNKRGEKLESANTGAHTNTHTLSSPISPQTTYKRTQQIKNALLFPLITCPDSVYNKCLLP